MNLKEMENERNAEHISLPQFCRSIRKSCPALPKEHENKNCTDSVVGKGRTENRKVIVRSSYFLHKQVNKDDQENKQEKLVVENDAAIDMSENTGLQSAHFDNSYLKGTAIKRKTSLIDSVHTVGASFVCLHVPSICSFGSVGLRSSGTFLILTFSNSFRTKWDPSSCVQMHLFITMVCTYS